MLAGLEAGCSAPVAALGIASGRDRDACAAGWWLSTAALNWTRRRPARSAATPRPTDLGRRLAADLLERGAAGILGP